MTRFCSPHKCTVYIKARENFIYVFVGMRRGKNRPIHVLLCSCMLTNTYTYLPLLYYIVYRSPSIVYVLFYDNISSQTAQHFSSLLESALNDTLLLEEKSGVCIVWMHLEEILFYLHGNLKWNVDKCLSQTKLGRKEWKKWLHFLPLFYNIYSPSGSCEVLWLHIFFFMWYLQFSSFSTVAIMMLLTLMLSTNLYKPNLALIMQDSPTWSSNSCWPPLVYAPTYKCQRVQVPSVPGPVFIGQGWSLHSLGRHDQIQSTTELLWDEH